MRRNNSSKIIVSLIVVVLGLAIYFFQNQRSSGNDFHPSANSQNVINPNTRLTFTKHAKCRMDCRNISESEIREVLQEGRINPQKSNGADRPCPTYAIEDRVKSGQKLRIVFGKCGNEVRVITCIDLEREYDCDCR